MIKRFIMTLPETVRRREKFAMTWKRKLRGLLLLALLLMFIRHGAGARAAESVKLSLGDIIQGIESNQHLWQAQKSWMVNYHVG